MASGIARGRGRGRVRATTTAMTESRNMAAITERRLNLLSWIFFWLGPLDSGVDEIPSKNEREREKSRARINRDRSSQEDRERERAYGFLKILMILL